jgi:hypothetical protein
MLYYTPPTGDFKGYEIDLITSVVYTGFNKADAILLKGG